MGVVGAENKEGPPDGEPSKYMCGLSRRPLALPYLGMEQGMLAAGVFRKHGTTGLSVSRSESFSGSSLATERRP